MVLHDQRGELARLLYTLEGKPSRSEMRPEFDALPEPERRSFEQKATDLLNETEPPRLPL